MTTTIKRGQLYKKRRTGTVRELKGFTTKPDGVKRARLVDVYGRETKVRVDQFTKTYRSVDSEEE